MTTPAQPHPRAGNPGSELARSLNVEARRAEERRMVARYAEALTAAGFVVEESSVLPLLKVTDRREPVKEPDR